MFNIIKKPLFIGTGANRIRKVINNAGPVILYPTDKGIILNFIENNLTVNVGCKRLSKNLKTPLDVSGNNIFNMSGYPLVIKDKNISRKELNKCLKAIIRKDPLKIKSFVDKNEMEILDKQYFHLNDKDIISTGHVYPIFNGNEYLKAPGLSTSMARQFIEQTKDGMFALSVWGNFLYANPTAKKTTGLSNYSGSSFTAFIHPDDKPAAVEMFETALKGQHPGLKELRVKTIKGKYIVGQYNLFPLYNEKKKIIGVAGTSRNITDQKALEEELRYDEQLKAIGLLMKFIKHTFNNIMTVINLESEMSLRDKPKAYENIHRSIVRMTKMMENVNRIVSKIEPSPRSVKLKDIVETTLQEFKRTDPNMTIITNYESDATVFADAYLIQAVVLDILGNSKDAMKLQNEQRIEIDLKKEKNWLMLKIKDNGHGIDKELHKDVFDPFFTTDERVGERMGLGLAIAKRIVREHNGTIWVESDGKNGTTVVIKLPVENKENPRLPDPLSEE